MQLNSISAWQQVAWSFSHAQSDRTKQCALHLRQLVDQPPHQTVMPAKQRAQKGNCLIEHTAVFSGGSPSPPVLLLILSPLSSRCPLQRIARGHLEGSSSQMAVWLYRQKVRWLLIRSDTCSHSKKVPLLKGTKRLKINNNNNDMAPMFRLNFLTCSQELT